MKNKTNFVLDAVIFLGFLAAAVPSLTGLPIHEWLGVALAGTLIVHLLLHMDWLWGVLKRFFKNLWHSSRLNFVVNLAVLMAYVGVTLSGILISRDVVSVFGIQLQENRTWQAIHSLTANATIWLTALHFALHWRWIVNAFKRYILVPVGRLFKREKISIPADPRLEPVRVEVRTDRS